MIATPFKPRELLIFASFFQLTLTPFAAPGPQFVVGTRDTADTADVFHLVEPFLPFENSHWGEGGLAMKMRRSGESEVTTT